MGAKTTNITQSKNTKKKVDTQQERKGSSISFLWGSWREKTPTEEYLKGLAKDMVEWVESDEDAFRLGRFFILKKLPKSTFERWKKNSEDLQYAVEFAKEVIAERRETGAIKRKYDTFAALRQMAHYDDDWKAIDQWNASLKQHADQLHTVKIVNIPDIPDSPMVPEKT